MGVLAKDIARDFSPVGPMIRGSGFARDVRKVHPFSGYGDIPFNLFTEANGDVLSRVKVRINEVFESMNIIDYMVDNLPSGEILKEGFNYTPGRFCFRDYRSSTWRRYSLVNARRQPKTFPLALSCCHLC